MPTYNYKCKNCNLSFSIFQKMNESPKSKCKDCGGMLERIITGGTGMIFKGSGFYLTDYKKSDSKNKLTKKKKKVKKK